MAKQSKKKVSSWWHAVPGLGAIIASEQGRRNRNKLKKTSKNTKSKLTNKDKEDSKKEEGLTKTLAALNKGGGTLKDPGPGKKGSFVPSKKKKSTTTSKKDPNAKYKPKAGTAASRIQQKLRDGGHTQAGLNEKAARHAAWKKARKEGTLGDWEKKYHPGRTPEYRNKKKSSSKTSSNKETLKATQGKSMPSNPKGMRQEGVGKTAKDLTRHTKKKKKPLGSRLAATFD